MPASFLGFFYPPKCKETQGSRERMTAGGQSPVSIFQNIPVQRTSA